MRGVQCGRYATYQLLPSVAAPEVDLGCRSCRLNPDNNFFGLESGSISHASRGLRLAVLTVTLPGLRVFGQNCDKKVTLVLRLDRKCVAYKGKTNQHMRAIRRSSTMLELVLFHFSCSS